MTIALTCKVCGGRMPMFGGRYGGLVTAPSELPGLDGVSIVAFDAGWHDPDTVREHGVCGIACAVREYNEALQALMGATPVAHMAPAPRAEGGING